MIVTISKLNNLYLTILNKESLKSLIQVQKRFTGKLPGHVHKILAFANKSKLNQNVPLTKNTDVVPCTQNNSNIPNTTIQEIPCDKLFISNEIEKISNQHPDVITIMSTIKKTGITILPNRILMELNTQVSLRKLVGYLLIIFSKTKTYEHFKDSGLKIHYEINTSKNDIIISKGIEKSLAILANNKDLENNLPAIMEQLVLKQVFGFLFNNTLPGTPIFRLAIIQRIGGIPKVSRGFIHEMLLQASDDKEVLSTIVVENPFVQADLNFINEVTVAYSHIAFVQKYISKNDIKSYILLSETIDGSTEQRNSFYYTGQKNCDVKIILSNKKCLFLDIKQKEINHDDFNNNFIKVIYNSKNGYNDPQGLNNYLLGTYNKVKKLNIALNIIAELSDLAKFINPKNIKVTPLEKVIMIHRFVLDNFNKPYAKFTVMIIQEIQVPLYHQKNIESIPDDAVTEFTPTLFDPKTQPNIFPDAVSKFLKTHHILETTDNLIDSWSHKTNIIESIQHHSQ